MAKQLAVKLRKSSSLIIIAKNDTINEKKANYKVLLFNRNEKATFMPNQAVFPGGVLEVTDESTKWRRYFQSCNQTIEIEGISNTNVQKLPSDLDLRITAIRETFEEVGILLSRDCDSMKCTNSTMYGSVKEDFNRHYWQKCVHNDSSKFLTLCVDLKILPDVYNLHVWSNWITPATFPKRFDTIFYIVILPELPQVISEKVEVKNFEWKSPHEFLQDYYNKKIWLPPPQIYELSRLLNFNNVDKLNEFLQHRKQHICKSNPLVALLPVQYKCLNGVVSILPGDELYPPEPNEFTEMVRTEKSIEDFSKNLKCLHRLEFFDSYDCVIRANTESTTFHQLLPVNCNPIRK